MEYKTGAKPKGRVPKRVSRAKIAARYPIVRLAPRQQPTISSQPSVFKDKLHVKLNYYDQASITTGIASAGSYVFAANGLFDPDITSTGHQPMGFDQLMLMYNHYTVLSSKITVWARNNSATEHVQFAVATYAEATTLTVPGRIVENGKLNYSILNPQPNNGSCKRYMRNVDIAKFMGQKEIMSEDDYRGDVAANPVELVYHDLIAWNLNPGAAAGTVTFDILIEYQAVFWEPRKLTQS